MLNHFTKILLLNLFKFCWNYYNKGFDVAVGNKTTQAVVATHVQNLSSAIAEINHNQHHVRNHFRNHKRDHERNHKRNHERNHKRNQERLLSKMGLKISHAVREVKSTNKK